MPEATETVSSPTPAVEPMRLSGLEPVLLGEGARVRLPSPAAVEITSGANPWSIAARAAA